MYVVYKNNPILEGLKQEKKKRKCEREKKRRIDLKSKGYVLYSRYIHPDDVPEMDVLYKVVSERRKIPNNLGL